MWPADNKVRNVWLAVVAVRSEYRVGVTVLDGLSCGCLDYQIIVPFTVG
jgi:hypothetical protein